MVEAVPHVACTKWSNMLSKDPGLKVSNAVSHKNRSVGFGCVKRLYNKWKAPNNKICKILLENSTLKANPNWRRRTSTADMTDIEGMHYLTQSAKYKSESSRLTKRLSIHNRSSSPTGGTHLI